MKLGAFSISLSVKDIAVSKDFYEKFGFVPFMGEVEQGWLMLRNEEIVIGLFQGMFEGNLLTFNPGWNQQAESLPYFQDIRDIQNSLKRQGIALDAEADEATTGPASFMLKDPDGNVLLFDQHV